MKPRVEYLFSSPDGDISLSRKVLSMPFLLGPSYPHPFLTLGDYFNTIRNFILRSNTFNSIEFPTDQSITNVQLEDVDKLVIRSEKHGALYHISSVEILFSNERLKIAVSTALSETSRRYIKQEYEIFNYLNSYYDYPYIPMSYDLQDMECAVKKGKETFTMLSSEWLDNYYEWHLSQDNPENIARPYIWSINGECRFATIDESLDMFREISKILTLFYNPKDFRQIRSWHHSAGDFVVSTTSGIIEMRLTTVRKYEPIPELKVNTIIDPQIALVYFFLYTTLKTRVDKVDGTGPIIWADPCLLGASIDGFFKALRIKIAVGKFKSEEIERTFSLLKSFGKDELKKIFDHLLIIYLDEDSEESQALMEGISEHINHLHFALQNYHL